MQEMSTEVLHHVDAETKTKTSGVLMARLPKALLLYILSYFDLHTRGFIKQVCKMLNAYCEESSALPPCLKLGLHAGEREREKRALN